jgi:hypothetical protein
VRRHQSRGCQQQAVSGVQAVKGAAHSDLAELQRLRRPVADHPRLGPLHIRRSLCNGLWLRLRLLFLTLLLRPHLQDLLLLLLLLLLLKTASTAICIAWLLLLPAVLMLSSGQRQAHAGLSCGLPHAVDAIH